MKTILLILLFSTIVFSRQIEVKCPDHCKCDIFEKLLRATCSRRNIANVESYIPPRSQILDLSYNQITKLDDYVFEKEKLLELRLLNISHNKIGEIAMNAFDGLTKLKTLDLSYNGIHSILRNWFFTLTSLQELYLGGNSFSELKDGPIFNSDSLKKLDLSNSGIAYIQPDSFWNIPNIETLDLSENFLIQLKADTIRTLTNLNTLNIDCKDLKKDDTFHDLSNLCLKRGIRLITPFKPTIKSSEKFQEIIQAPTEDERNSWLLDEENTVTADKNMTITCNSTQRDDKSLLQEILDLSPTLSLIIPFVYGIAVGIVAVYVYNFLIERREAKRGSTENTYISFEDSTPHQRRGGMGAFRSLRSLHKEREDDQTYFTLEEWQNSETTPMPLRRELSRDERLK